MTNNNDLLDVLEDAEEIKEALIERKLTNREVYAQYGERSDGEFWAASVLYDDEELFEVQASSERALVELFEGLEILYIPEGISS